MPRTKCKEVYRFNELSDTAKDKAREWYRDGAFDDDWWDAVYEDAARIGAMLGIDLHQKPVKLMNGRTRLDPEIYFSGFDHQGQGSAYGATWKAENVQAQALKKEAPQDKELHRLADVFTELAKENPELSATVSPKRDTDLEINVEHGETRENLVNELEYKSKEYEAETQADQERADTLEEALNDFNRWIFRQLRTEYDWLNSDEQVDEAIDANGYEFLEDGTRDH